VYGVDIVPEFNVLEERFDKVFGPDNRLPRDHLRLVDAGKPLTLVIRR
jgi:hypothetical protein